MTEDNLRIKLAEAMGWKHEQMRENLRRPSWRLPPAEDWIFPIDLPDPETDANDDYAVLEFMRSRIRDSEPNKQQQLYDHFTLFLPNGKYDYKIGDYARAALKVLEIK